MSLVIISMMTIVALGIVFADEEVCPCNEDNEGCVPAPIEDVENTNGNVQPTNTCMRTWIEYRNCNSPQWGNWHVITYTRWGDGWKTWCQRLYTQECDKYRVWYNNCTHQVMYEEYLGRKTRVIDSDDRIIKDSWVHC